MQRRRRGLYEGLVTVVGLAALFAGFSPLLSLPGLLQWLLVGGAIVIGLVVVVADIRSGTQPLVATLKVLGISIFVGGFLYGLGRYFSSLATSGESLTIF